MDASTSEDLNRRAAAFGQRVREIRESATPPLSMGKAAKRAGFTPARWSSIEKAAVDARTGRASMPAVPIVRAIADALDADRAELLELAGYEEDAAFDRARQARQARGTRDDERPQLAALNADLSTLDDEAIEAVHEIVKRFRPKGDLDG